MKAGLHMLIIIIVMVSFGACKKYPKRGEAVNKGEIIGDYVLPECYEYTRPGNDIIIDDTSDLRPLSCANGPFNFDFNSYSILGRTISGKCDLKIIRELKIDHDNKVYIYKISYKDVGLCGRKITNRNCVLVPKIPPDYHVDMIVHQDGL